MTRILSFMGRSPGWCKIIPSKKALLLLYLGCVLFFSPLSHSVYAAAFTVNTAADTADASPGDGSCADSGGNCSLRAALEEANALAGPHTINFNIPTTDSNFVDTSGSDCDAGNDGTPDTSPCWWRLDTNLSLTLNQSVTIDGTTQTTNVGDTNPGTLGGGGTVGTSSAALPPFSRPEIQVNFGGWPTWITVNANNFTLQGVSLTAQGDGIINLQSGASGHQISQNFIGLNPDGTTGTGYIGWAIGFYADGGSIDHNYIGGIDGIGLRIGDAANRSPSVTIEYNEIFDAGNGAGIDWGDGIEINGSNASAPVTVRYNLIRNSATSGSADTGGNGIEVSYDASVTISENSIQNNAHNGIYNFNNIAQGHTITNNLLINNSYAGLRSQNSQNNTITGNQIANNSQQGIDFVFVFNTALNNNTLNGNTDAGALLRGNSQNNTLISNDIYSNGASGVCVRGSGWNNTFTSNTIHNNTGPGVLLKYSGSDSANYTGVRISQNSFYDNSGLGIDLSVNNSDDCASGTGVTANDSDDPDNGPNRLLNFPVIKDAWLNGSNDLVVLGSLNTEDNAFYYDFTLELYAQDGGTDANGEGQTYLGNTTLSYSGGADVYWLLTIPAASHSLILGDKITALVTDSQNSTSEFSANATVQSGGYTLGGRVFEDADGEGDAYGEPGDGNKTGVAIRLYYDLNGGGALTAHDAFIASASSTASGFQFTDVGPTEYVMIVDSRDVTPTAGLNAGFTAPDIWAEQTRGCDHGGGTTTCGTRFGGETAGASDGFDPASVAPADNTAAQHANAADVSGNVTGLNFGFSFNVFTNVGESDQEAGSNRFAQGALRQFINNANAISGANSGRFVPGVAANAAGSGGNWWQITSSGAFTITDSLTTLDGTAYASADGVTVRDDNPGQVGTGGTVGTMNEPVSQYNRPELEINAVYANPAFFLDANNIVLENFALYNYSIGVEVGTNRTGAQILDNLIGIRADGSEPSNIQYSLTCDTASGHNCQIAAIITGENADTLVSHNLVSYNRSYAIKAGPKNDPPSNVTGGATIQYTEIFTNGFGAEFGDGLALHSNNNIVQYNLIYNNLSGGDDGVGPLTGLRQDAGAGIEIFQGDNSVILGNTLFGNGRHGIGLVYLANGSVIQQNIIYNNGSDTTGYPPGSTPGPGILVTNQTNAYDHTITQNSIYDNSGLGIDQDATGSIGGTPTNGDGVTAGNCAGSVTPPNRLMQRPTLSASSNWIVSVSACPGAIIELFKADSSGSGQVYLTTVTDSDMNGSEIVDLSPFALAGQPLEGGGSVVATATDANGSSSEFSNSVGFGPTALALVYFGAKALPGWNTLWYMLILAVLGIFTTLSFASLNYPGVFPQAENIRQTYQPLLTVCHLCIQYNYELRVEPR